VAKLKHYLGTKLEQRGAQRLEARYEQRVKRDLEIDLLRPKRDLLTPKRCPENLLIDENCNVQLADFSLANRVQGRHAKVLIYIYIYVCVCVCIYFKGGHGNIYIYIYMYTTCCSRTIQWDEVRQADSPDCRSFSWHVCEYVCVCVCVCVCMCVYAPRVSV